MSFTERRLRKQCDLIAMLTSVAASACFGRARNTAVAGARPFGAENLRFKATGLRALRRLISLIQSARLWRSLPGRALTWDSVTTGNLAGIDLWLDQTKSGSIKIETNVVSGEVDLGRLAGDRISFKGGGLDRKISVYRLPENEWSRRVTLDHTVAFSGKTDLPVYVRVTQADGNQAWSSPIYLIA